MKIEFFFDFETRSHLDLKKVGSVKYSTHPTTEATVLTWCFGRSTPVRSWRIGQPIPTELIHVAMNPEKYMFIAFNVMFDYLIWTQVFSRLIPGLKAPKVENISDAMALTSHFRVGASLEAAAQILNLPFTKHKEGRAIMLRHCKPNKTGKYPELTSQEWDKLEHYAIVDTKLLRMVYTMVPQLPSAERWAWEWTFKRNLKGIKLDMDLVYELSDIVTQWAPIYCREFEVLTNMRATVNSPVKCKEFFKQYYPEIEDMQADTLRDLLADKRRVPQNVRRALEIKDLAGGASLAKLKAALRQNYQGKIYGNLAYAHAQTKRWAGRGLQVHNVPRVDDKRPDKIDFELNAKSIVEEVQRVRPHLKDPLGFVKNMLRRIFIPDSPDMRFYCGDWSKIEPTVLFWLVGLGEIPGNWYEDMAATIYNVSVASIGKESEERQLGKSAALGCLEADTEILTIRGYKKIKNINDYDILWDGEKWVKHEGLLAKGMKSVIRIEKLNIDATPDHLFLTKKGWRTSVEMDHEEDMKHLISDMYSEDGQLYQLNLKEVSKGMSKCAVYVGLNRVFELINSGEAKQELVLAVQTLLDLEQIPSQTHAATYWAMQGLESVGTHVSTILKKDAKIIIRRTGSAMEVEEFSADLHPLEIFWNTLLRLIGLTNGDSQLIGLIMMDTMNPETYESLLKQKTTRIGETFDILNSGPDRRFRTRTSISHNCGYGMGHQKFREDTLKKSGLAISEALSKKAVQAYRSKYKEVVRFWYELEAGMRHAIYGQTSTTAGGKITIMPMPAPHKGVQILLPSGSILYYHRAHIIEDRLVKRRMPDGTIEEEIIRGGVGYVTDEDGSPTIKKIYGGLLCEHVTSCTARDIILPALYNLENAGFDILNLVHDEMWGQGAPGRDEEFERIMCINPSWCKDMKIGAGMKNGWRYLK